MVQNGPGVPQDKALERTLGVGVSWFEVSGENGQAAPGTVC